MTRLLEGFRWGTGNAGSIRGLFTYQNKPLPGARLKFAPFIILLSCAWLSACGGNNTPDTVLSGGSSQPAASVYGPLRQQGRWLIDAQGRAVTLHGINITFPQFYEDADLSARYRDDALFLVSQGLNVVRLALFLSGFMPEPGVYDERYLDKYAALVKTLTDAGLYVMVDAHQDLYANKYYGRGMPEWMAVDDGLPNAPNMMGNLFLNYALNPTVQRAFDNFWNNVPAADGVPLQTHYGRALQQLALRLRDNPAVLGYEFMNEPFPGSQFLSCATPLGCPLFDGQYLTAFSRRMAVFIREVDTRKIVFYEPNVTFDFGANTWHGDIEDDNAVLSFHDYCLGNQFGDSPVDNAATCEQAGERPQFQYALDHATQYNKAAILTEFGHFTGAATTNTGPIVTRMTRIADDFMFSWAYWHYDGVSAYTLVKDAAKPLAGDNLYPNIIGAVVRTYPRAIAGTPLAWSYAADSKRFELTYNTTRVDGSGKFGAGALSEIFLPSRNYPNGYEVSVENGSVKPSGNAELLWLSAANDALPVHVVITAK